MWDLPWQLAFALRSFIHSHSWKLESSLIYPPLYSQVSQIRVFALVSLVPTSPALQCLKHVRRCEYEWIHQYLYKYWCEPELTPKSESQVWLLFTAVTDKSTFLFLFPCSEFQPMVHLCQNSVRKVCSIWNSSSILQTYRQMGSSIISHKIF